MKFEQVIFGDLRKTARAADALSDRDGGARGAAASERQPKPLWCLPPWTALAVHYGIGGFPDG